MTDHCRLHRGRAAAGYGWTHISDLSCPLLLLGARCRLSVGDDCLCADRLNDHGNRWRDARGRDLIVWEPYDCWPEELAAVAEHAHRHGLRVRLSGRSPWKPGHTLAIEFRAAS